VAVGAGLGIALAWQGSGSAAAPAEVTGPVRGDGEAEPSTDLSLSQPGLGAEDGGAGAEAKRAGSPMERQMDEAGAHLQAGRPAEAARLYRKVLGRAPRNVGAMAGLGQAESELGQHDEALGHLKRATRLRPRNIEYRLRYARALERAGRAAEARTQYREVLRVDPGNAVARRMLEAPR
jgi:tetratricopeptide (TPR) repeat protein